MILFYFIMIIILLFNPILQMKICLFHTLLFQYHYHYYSSYQDPLFQAYVCDNIRTYWIPFVENLDIENGRKAIWNQKKSVIMFEGDEVGN